MDTPKMKCPRCGKDLYEDEESCPFCGYTPQKTLQKKIPAGIVTLVFLCALIVFNLDSITQVVQKAQAAAERRQNQELSFEDTLRTFAFWLPQRIDTNPDSADMKQAHQQLLAYREEHPGSLYRERNFLASLDYLPEDAEAILAAFDTDYVAQARSIAQALLEDETCHPGKIKNQLIFDRFTEEEIQKVMDSLEEDWNARALKKANDYMDRGYEYSRDTLEFSLKLDGFEPESRTYAVEHCSGDWMYIVVHDAQDFLDENPELGERELILYLEEEDYTKIEILHALKELSE